MAFGIIYHARFAAFEVSIIHMFLLTIYPNSRGIDELFNIMSSLGEYQTCQIVDASLIRVFNYISPRLLLYMFD